LSFGVNLEKGFYDKRGACDLRLEKMAEQQKVVGRGAALILGAICVVLAVGMVVALIAYLPATSQIDTLNARIVQKDQSIAALNSEIATLNAQISSQSGQNSTSNDAALQVEINDLESQINYMNNIFYLNITGTLVSNQAFTMDPNSNITMWDQTNEPMIYPGYVTVQLQSSSNTTFVELAYNAYGVVYDNVIETGAIGTAAFPVLPGAITITLGNTETNAPVTGTVTATYIY
jgi:cell division protein FtsL